ncbi:MAG: cytochrome c biogenesis protein CcsA, partial [Planctomycetota bacterium]|nr:cytochrome c biogenesis protein CcsA [Planctomycetota bacterium]
YSTYEKKMIDLNRRFQIVALLLNSFDDRLAKELVANPDMVRERPEAVIQQLSAKNEQLRSRKPPLVIPGSADEDWVPYSLALEVEALRQIVAGHGGQPQNEATAKLAAIFDAYGKDNPGAFNAAVNRYHTYINDLAPKQLADASPRLESFFSNFEPFYYAAELYVIAMFLALIAWLFGSKIFASMSFWIVVFTFVVHSAALVLRMYIAGRPPVTNLYASAVFIAWACVGIGLILEMIFHRVYGTIVASVAGFSSLFIAHLLATQVVGHNGDTIGVQQAVLDTNFWLATHVVCITIGYATTFLAGILGILYILGGVFTRKLIPEVSKDLGRMIYGTLCGALLFSFFGTVLGGLWGDDSWGRFWGWDPKETAR